MYVVVVGGEGSYFLNDNERRKGIITFLPPPFIYSLLLTSSPFVYFRPEFILHKSLLKLPQSGLYTADLPIDTGGPGSDKRFRKCNK